MRLTDWQPYYKGYAVEVHGYTLYTMNKIAIKDPEIEWVITEVMQVYGSWLWVAEPKQITIQPPWT